jgi:CarD family transcriptional regulator, regulator of rRNA transcription
MQTSLRAGAGSASHPFGFRGPEFRKRGSGMFKVGDVVVYPIHGVARITDIKTEKIGNSDQLCYILETEIKTANERPLIKLPVNKVGANGVRKIVDEKQVPKVIDVLKDRGMKTDTQTWNRRHREYQDKMRSGSIFKAAEVFRDLSLLKQSKDLSHGERRLFDQARNLLIKELSLAKKTDEKDIENTISEIFQESISSVNEEEA